MNNINVYFNEDTKVLTISGSGDLSWKDTVEYSENTEEVVIEGIHIFSTNMSNLFAHFKKLRSIKGNIDTSNCKDMSYLYAECHSLVEPIKRLDTSMNEEFDFMHSDNHSLKEVEFNDTSNGIKFQHMFYGCKLLESIKGLTIPEFIDIVDITNLDEVVNLIHAIKL